ncbi:hypothetical protein MSAN_00882300 [Mycena sanguinolenta]|uniref:DUF6534 domain-containing protein n=1 Tax=Mycena sanguinolenta TaxID=230812 RepID=A0A8H6YXT6_9AGAR|nr:hypothetical protein MSAN_00882300 [Mycena sanguinolenta]
MIFCEMFQPLQDPHLDRRTMFRTPNDCLAWWHSAAPADLDSRLERILPATYKGRALNEYSSSALLIGTWAGSLLYMAELLQAVYYFRTFKDNWKLKSYIAIAFAVDTISAVADYICVYLYTITHAGDLAYLTKQNWPVPLYIISTTTVAFLAQSFLAFRYWRMTKNTLFVCFLSILILGAVGGGFSAGFTVALFPAYKDRNKARISGAAWIVTQVSADLIIAGALVRELMKAKSLFKGQRRINNVLNRMIFHTIQTGTVTAAMTVLALVAFLINDETNIPVGIIYPPRPRLFMIFQLINLNIRDSGRSKNSTISVGQRGQLVSAHGTTYNFTTEFYPSEPDSNTSGSVKSNALVNPPIQRALG